MAQIHSFWTPLAVASSLQGFARMPYFFFRLMLRVYQYESCPFCRQVRSALEVLGFKIGQDYELLDAMRNTPGRLELLRLGGKNQVPFLVDEDEGVKMYESEAIITYLRNKSILTKNEEG